MESARYEVYGRQTFAASSCGRDASMANQTSLLGVRIFNFSRFTHIEQALNGANVVFNRTRRG